MERLDKLLAATGRWSRREVKDLVRQGRVELDGQPAAAADVKIDPAAADIRVDGEALSYSRFTYLMLHKPADVLSAARDSRQKTVLDLLPLGFNDLMHGYFRTLCVGYGLYAVGNTILMILLYFTDYGGAVAGGPSG